MTDDMSDQTLAPLPEGRRAVLYALRRRGQATADDIARQLDMTASGARQHLTALVDDGLAEATERAATRRAARPATARVHGHRQGRRAVPEGLRRAHERAARLRRRHRRGTRRHALRATPRRARAQRDRAPREGRGLKAKVAELTPHPRRRRLPRDMGGDPRRLPHRRAQLRDLGRRAALRPGVHERDRLHPHRAARARASTASSTWSPARPTARTRCGRHAEGVTDHAFELLSGDASPAEIDEALAYLEADAYYFWSGYARARLARRLAGLALSAAQRTRARQYVLDVVDGTKHCGQPELAQLARSVADNPMRKLLRSRLHSPDTRVARRAVRTLARCGIRGWSRQTSPLRARARARRCRTYAVAPTKRRAPRALALDSRLGGGAARPTRSTTGPSERRPRS